MIDDALNFAPDVYITGDIDHHEGIDAVARGMNVIDAGHYGLEKIFVPYMKEYNRDIAYNKWGGKWRLPSMQDFNELANVCDMTVETLNGVQGLRCTSRVTGNSIFFPAAGRRSNYHFDVADRGKVLEMWTGGYPTLGNFTKDGLYAYFMLSTSTSFVSRFNDFRVGRSIRPVNDDYYPYSY